MMSKKTFSRLSAAILLLLTVSTPVGAQEISVEAARQTAAKFINEHAAKLLAKSRKGMMKAPPKAESLQLVYTQEDQLHESPALYVFEQPKQGGFIIASADERVAPIFGYFEEGNFQDAVKESCCFKTVLENFGQQIAYARENGLPQFTSTLNDDNDFSPIEPITRNGVRWHQEGEGLNDYCPIDKNTGKRSVTGCVANTMAILMYHHQWPERGVGSHSYQWRDTTLTANFEETTYHYELMGPNGSLETALLLYHCGVAVNMDYSSHLSGAWPHANNAMERFFRYNYVKDITGGDYTKVSEIHDALSHNNPLYADGYDHAFLIDGYQPGGFIHLNLHSGFANGYVHISGLKDGWSDDGISTWTSSYSFYDGSKFNIGLFVPEKDVTTITKDEMEYEIVFNKATITKGTGTGDFVIPSSIRDEKGEVYPVTRIGDDAFKDCSGLTSITIPNSVTSIGDYAFSGCSGLTSVTIPNSVTSIGVSAFSGCPGLTSVTIPNSVESIGSLAFYGCSGLTSVTIPNSVTAIGSWAFYETGIYNNSADGVFYVDKWACGYKGTMPANTNLVIREGTLGIADNAFSGCSGLTSITIPNSVTSIGDYASSGCSGLTSVTIGNSVTSIGNGAFEGCSSLTSVTFHCKEIGPWFRGITTIKEIVLGEEVTSIGGLAFCDCSGLTSVAIPNSVKSIGSQAFFKCSGLTSVTIGNSVKSIGSQAFYNCSGLTSVTIGNSVTSIGSWAFYGCYDLKSVTIPNSVTSIGDDAFSSTGIYNNSADGVFYVDKWACGYKGTMPANTNLVIREGTLGIADHAFWSESNLTGIKIPNSVTSISSGAFYDCRNLTSITIPNSVTSIGNYAFQYCSGLTSVTIPNSVTSIGKQAFLDCSGLKNITIPNSVTSIGSYAFYGCSGLKSVTSCIENPFAIDNSVFSYYYATLYVPIGTSDKYKSTYSWKNFKNIVEIEIDGIEGVTVSNSNSSDSENAPMYNLSGQRVGKNYKGIVIKNGKKMIVK